MNYKLAKELKDAGWSQKPSDALSLLIGDKPLKESELIEACGTPFRELEKYSNTENGKLGYYWSAYAIDDATGRMTGGSKARGTTPEEAVANLWLALNENK